MTKTKRQMRAEAVERLKEYRKVSEEKNVLLTNAGVLECIIGHEVSVYFMDPERTVEHAICLLTDDKPPHDVPKPAKSEEPMGKDGKADAVPGAELTLRSGAVNDGARYIDYFELLLEEAELNLSLGDYNNLLRYIQHNL